jgi:prepilin-type N-terminal cleavage/methylation domain-containing protein
MATAEEYFAARAGGAMVIATGRGFSVIELVIVLAMIGIMAAMALPAWNRILPSFHLASAARIIQSELQSIKIRSASENVSFRLSYAAGATNVEIQREGKAWAIKPLTDGVSIIRAGTVTFSPRGTASGNRVRLISRDGSCQQVVVSHTGRMRTCKAACGDDC